MSKLIRTIKRLTPPRLIAGYHLLLAELANFWYDRPSEKMIVIGVTGTNGKTTTVMLIVKILEQADYKVGAASTAMFKVADREWLNDTKMTMLGRFALQKMLRQMAGAGCQYAIVETSSQGIEQFRHIGIHYDACVFTNLTPEHIEAHGGFENYKEAKLKLFKHLEKLPVKTLSGHAVEKVIAVNGDDQYAKEFLDFKIEKKYVFGINQADREFSILNFSATGESAYGGQLVYALNIQCLPDGLRFFVNDIDFNLKLFGEFNVYNTLAAIAVAQSQGISLETAKAALEKVESLPGRMEFIDEGQKFKILIDYAPEPESMKQLFETIKKHQIVPKDGKIIHVFGSCGGGRDVARRPILGGLSAKNADIQIITNEDPYDDDPNTIIDQVASGAINEGKILEQNLYKISDRRTAIKLALSLARENDLVLLTGKGCEQAICVADGCKLDWDEREVVRQLLAAS